MPLIQTSSSQTNVIIESKNPSTVKDEFLGYHNNATNTHYGIRMSYPTDWRIEEQADSGSDDCDISIVSFFSPSFNPRGYNSEFSVALRLYDEETIPKNLKEELNFQKDIESLTYAHFKTIESDTHSTLAGYPAYKLVWTGEIDGIKEQIKEIGTIINGDVYYITYQAEPKTYSHYQSTVQKMIDSFKIEKGGVSQTKYFLPYENSAYGITKVTHIKCLGVTLPEQQP